VSADEHRRHQGEEQHLSPCHVDLAAPIALTTRSAHSGLRSVRAVTQLIRIADPRMDRAATRYSVQYRRHYTVEAWTAVLQPPTQPEYTVDGLTSGIAYDFRVAAVNATGQGLWSAVGFGK
jgi:hypothetical protein